MIHLQVSDLQVFFYATKKHVRKYETSVVLFCLTTDQNRRDPEHLSQPTDRLAWNLHVMSAIAISGGRPPIKTVSFHNTSRISDTAVLISGLQPRWVKIYDQKIWRPVFPGSGAVLIQKIGASGSLPSFIIPDGFTFGKPIANLAMSQEQVPSTFGTLLIYHSSARMSMIFSKNP